MSIFGTDEIRQSEFAPVSSRRDSGDALEQTSEKCRVLISDGPTDLVNGLIGSLQATLGFLNAHMLHICNRRIAGGFRKAAFEASFGDPGASDHLQRDSAYEWFQWLADRFADTERRSARGAHRIYRNWHP